MYAAAPISVVAFFAPSRQEPTNCTNTKLLSPSHRRVPRRDGLVAKRLAHRCARDDNSVACRHGRCCCCCCRWDDAGLEDKFTKASTRTASGHEAAAAATSTSFLRTIDRSPRSSTTRRAIQQSPTAITPHFARGAPKNLIPPRGFNIGAPHVFPHTHTRAEAGKGRCCGQRD